MKTTGTNDLMLAAPAALTSCGPVSGQPMAYGTSPSATLVRDLNHSNEGRREAAARCLLSIGQPAVPYLLVAMKHNPNPEVRWTAAWIMSSMKDGGARQTVCDLTRDEVQPKKTPSANPVVFHFCDKCGHRVSQADLDAGRARLVDPTHAVCAACEEVKPARIHPARSGKSRRHATVFARYKAPVADVGFRSAAAGLLVACSLLIAFVSYAI